MKNILLLITVVAIAGLSGYAAQRILSDDNFAAADFFAQTPQHIQTPNQIEGQRRPDFAMKDLEGTVRNINEWDGKIVLVNFWATWCPPCMREIPAFIELQQQYASSNFQILGIAIDDEQPVRDFVEESNINYPVFAGGPDAIELSQRFGNHIGALPFSVFIDQQGKIIKVRAGEVEKHEVEAIIRELSRG